MANEQINIITKKLKIIQINVNSLIKIERRYNLQQFLNNHNPDIMLLNETKLNSRHKINFNNYNTIRKDRKNAIMGGGTAILIKNDLKYRNYTCGSLDTLNYLEACIIKIPMPDNSSIFIISAYYPAGNNDYNLKIELSRLFEALDLQNVNNYYILAGDLNCKHNDWGNSINNPKGNKLKEWLLDNELNFRCKLYATCLPSFPRSQSFLDICIADCRSHIHGENNTINSLSTLDYESDHNAVQICASMNQEPIIYRYITDNIQIQLQDNKLEEI